MRPQSHTTTQRGYTLTEILMIVAIVAIVAVIAIASYFHVAERGRSAEALSTMNIIREAQATHQLEFGNFVEALDLPSINAALDLQLTSRHFDYAVEKPDDKEFLITATEHQPASSTKAPLRITMDHGGRVTYSWPGGGGTSGISSGGSAGGGGGVGSSTSRAGSGGGSSAGFAPSPLPSSQPLPVNPINPTPGGGPSGGCPPGSLDPACGPPPAIGKPTLTGFSCVANDGKVACGWDQPPNPSIAALLYRSSSPNGPFTEIGQVSAGGPVNFFADYGVTNDATYYYYARPLFFDNTNPLGDPTPVVSATPSATSPAAVKLNNLLNILLANPSTGQSPFVEDIGGFLQSNHVEMLYSPGLPTDLSGGESVLGLFVPSFHGIVLNNALFNESDNFEATVLAHEGTHTWYSLEPNEAIAATLSTHPSLTIDDLHISVPPEDSIDQEYEAFMAEFRLWSQIDDGTQPNYTQLSNFFLASSADVVKQTYIRPLYAGLPEY